MLKHMYKLCFLPVLFANPCVAQEAGDFMVSKVHFGYQEGAPGFFQQLLMARVSPAGQVVATAVASIWDVPPEVVEFETAVLKTLVEARDNGNEHIMLIRAPSNYHVCRADRTDLSVNGQSSITVRLQRRAGFDGYGGYAAVPVPAGIAPAGNSAEVTLTIVWLKSDANVWDKFSSKCQENNFMVVECDHGNCLATRVAHEFDFQK